MTVKPSKRPLMGRRPPRRREERGIIGSGSRKTGVQWRIVTDVPMQLDAVALLDHVTDVVLAQHLESITAGSLASGAGPQPELNRRGLQGRRAEEGKRPPVRGNTGLSVKAFGPSLIRTKLRVMKRPVKFRRTEVKLGVKVRQEIEGTRVKTTIEPDPIHKSWLASEAGRNIEYFYVDGLISHLVDIALAQWLDVAIDGALKAGDKRVRRAAKARTR